MPNKTYNSVQMKIDFAAQVGQGSGRLLDNVLYSNLETGEHTSGQPLPNNANIAVSLAKIYTWAKDLFAFNPSATGSTPKITLNDTSFNFIETVGGVNKIKESYLPSYVDDVVEGYYYNNQFYEDAEHTTLIDPEPGKIYVDISTNTSYRYGGTTYVAITNPIDVFTGATSSSAGVAGIVPAPAAGDQNKFLKGDGTWAPISAAVDEKVKVTASTAKAYLIGTTTSPDGTAVEGVGNTGVYMTDGTLTATNLSFSGTLNGASFTITSGSTYNLNDITKVEAATNPGDGTIKINGSPTTVYTHPTYTARTGKPTADVTIDFSTTTSFTMSQITSDALGHVTGANDKTITFSLPSAPSADRHNYYLRDDGSWHDPMSEYDTLILNCTYDTSVT